MKKFFLFISILLLVPGISAVMYGVIVGPDTFVHTGYVFIATGAVMHIIAERYSPRLRFRPRKEDMVQLVIALPAFSSLAYSILSQ
jgi:hypothetical protein